MALLVAEMGRKTKGPGQQLLPLFFFSLLLVLYEMQSLDTKGSVPKELHLQNLRDPFAASVCYHTCSAVNTAAAAITSSGISSGGGGGHGGSSSGDAGGGDSGSSDSGSGYGSATYHPRNDGGYHHNRRKNGGSSCGVSLHSMLAAIAFLLAAMTPVDRC
ncbi:hypothetical protein C4D60_Mb09t26100 [Musa balbisiana]|uniref:Uncharacterized protein n=1 Tax=Musa balbisiana TaxID=52838 RepID=A0A4S8IKJ3_MUSBA|nr:hypothetical protein C4D60_Mb09t26100 [Musa balbisiana]